MILVSACLAGIKCRYDGKDNLHADIRQLILEGKAIPLCPEELGGLPTPRISCELVNTSGSAKAISKDQQDFTAEFKKGAQKFADIARIVECKLAILKANSPSCGYGTIYDGTFSGQLSAGNGLTANLLAGMNIRIANEENYPSILNQKK